MTDKDQGLPDKVFRILGHGRASEIIADHVDMIEARVKAMELCELGRLKPRIAATDNRLAIADLEARVRAIESNYLKYPDPLTMAQGVMTDIPPVGDNPEERTYTLPKDMKEAQTRIEDLYRSVRDANKRESELMDRVKELEEEVKDIAGLHQEGIFSDHDHPGQTVTITRKDNPPPSTTRATAERCWGEMRPDIYYDDRKDEQSITRIQAAIDEGIKETLGREIEYGNELKVQIEKNHTLTAERDRLRHEVVTKLKLHPDAYHGPEPEPIKEIEEQVWDDIIAAHDRFDVPQNISFMDALRINITETFTELTAERDRLKEKIELVKKDRDQVLNDGQVIQAGWQEMVEDRDRLLGEVEAAVGEIRSYHRRERQPTPIDDAELERVATRIMADAVSGRDMLNATINEKIKPALRTVASRPLLPSTKEIEYAIDPDHGTHPDRKETVPAEWVGIAAGCVHELLVERGSRTVASSPMRAAPVVTEGELHRILGTLQTPLVMELIHRAGGRVVTREMLADVIIKERDALRKAGGFSPEAIVEVKHSVLADAILTAIDGSLRPLDAAEGKGE